MTPVDSAELSLTKSEREALAGFAAHPLATARRRALALTLLRAKGLLTPELPLRLTSLGEETLERCG
jgi:hypothetical protein